MKASMWSDECHQVLVLCQCDLPISTKGVYRRELGRWVHTSNRCEWLWWRVNGTGHLTVELVEVSCNPYPSIGLICDTYETAPKRKVVVYWSTNTLGNHGVKYCFYTLPECVDGERLCIVRQVDPQLWIRHCAQWWGLYSFLTSTSKYFFKKYSSATEVDAVSQNRSVDGDGDLMGHVLAFTMLGSFLFFLYWEQHAQQARPLE